MTNFRKIRHWLFYSLIIALIVPGYAACLHAQETKAADPLKIALLPIIDAFPYYVAEEKGYFEQLGVHVKVIPVVSGLERDQLMQSGEIDGMLNELITTANFNRQGVRV